jgi:hypothetical protein
MALLLAELAVDDADEQLGDKFVTLLTLGAGALLPDWIGGARQRARGCLEPESILVHCSLLSVEIHKK